MRCIHMQEMHTNNQTWHQYWAIRIYNIKLVGLIEIPTRSHKIYCLRAKLYKNKDNIKRGGHTAISEHKMLCKHNSILTLSFLTCSLINADFCVAGCLIAYGAVLGKVSPVQLMVLTLFGVTLFAIEEFIILDLIHVSDNNYIMHSM